MALIKMTISDFTAALEKVKAEHGDLFVRVEGFGGDYNIGFHVQDEDVVLFEDNS